MKKEAPKKVDEYKLAVGEVKRHMSALGEEYQGRIDAVIEQFGGMNRRFDHVDKKFELVDKKFDHIDKRFDLVDKRFTGIDKKLDAHTEMIGRIMIQLEEMKSDMRQKVDLQQFSRLEKRVVLLEAKSRR